MTTTTGSTIAYAYQYLSRNRRTEISPQANGRGARPRPSSINQPIEYSGTTFSLYALATSSRAVLASFLPARKSA